VAGIEEQLTLFTSAGCKVCVVSFGNLQVSLVTSNKIPDTTFTQGAAGWLSSTGCSLDMYLDSERHLYSTMGLHRSVSKVWNMLTLHYYASMLAQGRRLPAAIQGVEDDPLQMGGDFTFRCSDKVLVMTHPSKNPKDRPDIHTILKLE